MFLQSGLDKNGGLVLWNNVAFCEVFKTFRWKGKLFDERRFRELWKKGAVTPFTSQSSTNMVRKWHLEYSLDVCWSAAHNEELESGRVRNPKK